MKAASREAREGFVVVQLPSPACISELQLYFPSADTIWVFNLLPDHYRLCTDGVYTTSKFLLSGSCTRGPKEKWLNTHIVTEFSWLFHDNPRISAVGCFERKSGHLGLDPIQQKWKWLNSANSQDDVLGLGHPISWGEVQTEVRAVGALVWGSDSSDMGTCMGAWQPPLVPLGLSLVETFLVYAQAPGRKSQA